MRMGVAWFYPMSHEERLHKSLSQASEQQSTELFSSGIFRVLFAKHRRAQVTESIGSEIMAK